MSLMSGPLASLLGPPAFPGRSPPSDLAPECGCPRTWALSSSLVAVPAPTTHDKAQLLGSHGRSPLPPRPLLPPRPASCSRAVPAVPHWGGPVTVPSARRAHGVLVRLVLLDRVPRARRLPCLLWERKGPRRCPWDCRVLRPQRGEGGLSCRVLLPQGPGPEPLLPTSAGAAWRRVLLPGRWPSCRRLCVQRGLRDSHSVMQNKDTWGPALLSSQQAPYSAPAFRAGLRVQGVRDSTARGWARPAGFHLWGCVLAATLQAEWGTAAQLSRRHRSADGVWCGPSPPCPALSSLTVRARGRPAGGMQGPVLLCLRLGASAHVAPSPAELSRAGPPLRLSVVPPPPQCSCAGFSWDPPPGFVVKRPPRTPCPSCMSPRRATVCRRSETVLFTEAVCFGNAVWMFCCF